VAKLFAFAVRDDKVGAFAPPFFAPAVGMAVRMFGDWCLDPNVVVSKHPQDYRLYRVGFFDDNEGLFEVGKPELISSGSDHVPVVERIRSVS